MNPLTKDQFFAIWKVLLDNFKQSRDGFTLAFIYQTLMERDPELSADQFTYAIQQCLISCKFMPSLNEVLRQIYEPDLTGIPVMPDIDPKYADEYQLNHYNTALNTVNKWVAQNDHKPAVGHFREDRLLEIPGIPEEQRRLAAAGHSFGGYARPKQDFLGFGSSEPRAVSQHAEEMRLETSKRHAIERFKDAA